MTERPILLRHRLTLEARADIPDLGGGRDVTWVPIGEHHAAVQPSSGTESYDGSQQAQRVTHRVTVRCAPHGAAARPRPDQRFRAGERVFDIKAVFERDGRGKQLTCLCEETALS